MLVTSQFSALVKDVNLESVLAWPDAIERNFHHNEPVGEFLLAPEAKPINPDLVNVSSDKHIKPLLAIQALRCREDLFPSSINVLLSLVVKSCSHGNYKGSATPRENSQNQ